MRSSNRRADWAAGGPLHLPHAHASCTLKSPLYRQSDLLLPAFPAFETRSRRLDGSTRRLRTLTYSTSTMRRRRASHSQRGSRRLRGEVPHRKVEYFTRPRSMEMYILGGSVFHPACPRRLAACKTLASKFERVMQLFQYRSVRYWSKDINGTRTGGRKTKFFNSRPRSRHRPWRPRRWNPVNPGQTGLPRVA